MLVVGRRSCTSHFVKHHRFEMEEESDSYEPDSASGTEDDPSEDGSEQYFIYRILAIRIKPRSQAKLEALIRWGVSISDEPSDDPDQDKCDVPLRPLPVEQCSWEDFPDCLRGWDKIAAVYKIPDAKDSLWVAGWNFLVASTGELTGGKVIHFVLFISCSICTGQGIVQGVQACQKG